MVPSCILKKAKGILHEDTEGGHKLIKSFKDENGDPVFYILRRKGQYRELSRKLISAYASCGTRALPLLNLTNLTCCHPAGTTLHAKGIGIFPSC
jgi:hypothetical protein